MARITIHRPEDADARVRWRQGRSWRYGHYNGPLHVEADGSLRICDDHNGGARSLPADVLQRQTRGPRGGRRWEWLTPRPDADPTVAAPRPAWDPPEGPAELFNQEPLFEVAS